MDNLKAALLGCKPGTDLENPKDIQFSYLLELLDCFHTVLRLIIHLQCEVLSYQFLQHLAESE